MSMTEEEAKRMAEATRANEQRNNERLERLNAIANQGDEERDIEDVEEETWQDREEPGDEVPDAEPEDVIEARSHGADDVRETNGETYYRIIVNGQEKWLTLQQLRETSSKVTAADEYLRNAKQAAQNISGVPSTDEPQSRETGVRDMLTRALMGEQEAIDELARRLERTPSETDVLRAVDGRIDGRLTFRQAVDWFESEYADVLKIDPVRQRAVQVDAELAQQNPEMDFKARLKMVGDDARSYLGQLRNQLGVTTDLARSQKEARKASVRSLPAAGGRQAVDGDEGDDETYETTISKMASARGQGRPIIHKRS
jgi:hypothetical protein